LADARNAAVDAKTAFESAGTKEKHSDRERERELERVKLLWKEVVERLRGELREAREQAKAAENRAVAAMAREHEVSGQLDALRERAEEAEGALRSARGNTGVQVLKVGQGGKWGKGGEREEQEGIAEDDGMRERTRKLVPEQVGRARDGTSDSPSGVASDRDGYGYGYGKDEFASDSDLQAGAMELRSAEAKADQLLLSARTQAMRLRQKLSPKHGTRPMMHRPREQEAEAKPQVGPPPEKTPVRESASAGSKFGRPSSVDGSASPDDDEATPPPPGLQPKPMPEPLHSIAEPVEDASDDDISPTRVHASAPAPGLQRRPNLQLKLDSVADERIPFEREGGSKVQDKDAGERTVSMDPLEAPSDGADDVVTPLPEVHLEGRSRSATGRTAGSSDSRSDAGDSVSTAEYGSASDSRAASPRGRKRKSILKKVRLSANDSGKIIRRKNSATQLRGAVKKLTALRKAVGLMSSLGDVAVLAYAENSTTDSIKAKVRGDRATTEDEDESGEHVGRARGRGRSDSGAGTAASSREGSPSAGVVRSDHGGDGKRTTMRRRPSRLLEIVRSPRSGGSSVTSSPQHLARVVSASDLFSEGDTALTLEAHENATESKLVSDEKTAPQQVADGA